ncbi:MAG: SAF domain-containing protein [Pseudomonadota bacterium]
MNLHTLLCRRADDDNPVRVGVIGAGKFASMFFAQAVRTPGLHIVAVSDLKPAAARAALRRVGWRAEHTRARSAAAAWRARRTWVSDDTAALIASDAVEVVVDATGDAVAGARHALAAFAHGKHTVMVNVEADALVGPALAAQARSAGVVYSLAYGDQPALIAEQVDWARAAGFEVVAAGKGTKYLPHYHRVTPDDVWTHYGLSADDARRGGMNPTMFNSFLDGSKSAIEMAAVANACSLAAPASGLAFPPCGVDDLADVLKPRADGGQLDARGQVEVVSSLERDGRPVHRDLRWGVYVTFAADTDYVRRCFREYGLLTDASGNYAAMYKPTHLIGLELSISVASAALRGEPTGTAQGWHADVVAVAKRDLSAGEHLDGEGGYCVYGTLQPAARSKRQRALPLGLADGARLTRDVAAGTTLRLRDVALRVDEAVLQLRAALKPAAGT